MASFKSSDKLFGLWSRTAVLSAVHFAVDMYCAVLFFGFISGGEKAWTAMVLYNALAFAGQAPIGAIADRLGNGLAVAAAGCMVLACAWFFRAYPIALAVIAGIGNGAFHAGAGYSVLMGDTERAAGLGVFVSTGAIGLAIGTADAGFFSKGCWAFIALFALLALALGYFSLDKRFAAYLPERSGGAELSLDVPKGGAFALAMLTAVVILRAFIGSTECFAVPGVPAAAAVMFVAGGKALGGFIMDACGPRRTSLVSLVPCALLVLIGTGLAAGQSARLTALLLFNMTMPITLFAAARILKGAKGFAFGLLTFGLFIGYVPRFLGADTSVLPQWAYAVLILLSLAMLIAGLRFERDKAPSKGA